MSLCRRPIHRLAILTKTGETFSKSTLKSLSQQNIYTQLENTALDTQQLQLIGDEQRDDVIFKVYLKRVRHKPVALANSTSTLNTVTDESHEQTETSGDTHNNDRGTLLYSTIKVHQLKAGTLDKIVEYLTTDTGELDTTHMHILFSTYRRYTNTKTLIDTILSRYRAVLPASLDMTEDVRQKTIKSICMAISVFMNLYKEELNEPPLYSTLNHLIKHLPERDIQKQGQKLLEEFKKNEESNKSNSDYGSKHSSIYNEKGFDYLAPWNILEMSSTMIAEQLTIADAELLKRVLLHECLSIPASSCSRRAPANGSARILSTVEKTIEQFNAVVARVIATILKEQEEEMRAYVIEKWIDVAQQCRKIKNFSSLTAILNGLLSGCIYRLSTAWSFVTQDSQKTLDELKDVFGSCADRKKTRAILDKESAITFNDTSTTINATIGRKNRLKTKRDQNKATSIGAIPYLGFYLSDLTYIDSAYPHAITVENNNSNSPTKLIHFEKHRKEFEVLAQIKLFQSAANAYKNFQSLPRFKAWFDSIRIYTEPESWDLSYEIEPKEVTDHSQSHEQSLNALRERFPSVLSLESRITSNSNNNNGTIGSKMKSDDSLRSSPSLTSLDKISATSNHSLSQPTFQSQKSREDKNSYTTHSRSSSASSFLASSHGSSSQGYASATASPKISGANSVLNSTDNEVIIAKVHLAGKKDLLYKKVRIQNNERTTSVLKTILEKFGLNPSTYDRYCIEQQLPDRKILILDHCNVFYALARSSDDEQVELIVREKTRQECQSTSNNSYVGAGHNRTPSGISTSSSMHSR